MNIRYQYFKNIFTISYEAVDVGTHVLDGENLKLPPILLGTYGNDPNKKTILVYGHYDVQPVRNYYFLLYRIVGMLIFFQQSMLKLSLSMIQ
jgi:hypothetical protein